MTIQETSTKKYGINPNWVDLSLAASAVIITGGAIAYFGYTIACFVFSGNKREQLEVNTFKNTDLIITQAEDSVYLKKKLSTFDSTNYFIGAIAKKDIDTLNISYNSPEVYCDDTVIKFIGVPSRLEELTRTEVENNNITMTRTNSEAKYKGENAASKISNEMNLPQYTKIIRAKVYAPRTRK